MLEPRTSPEQYRQQQRDQQISDLADSHDQTTERMRQDGQAHADAENQRKLNPGEPRPREPKPKIKIRLRP